MSLTPKENILAVLNHEKGEWVPSWICDAIGAGFGSFPGPAFEKGPLGGGLDGFGIPWVTPASGGGAPIPHPNKFLLDSETIVDWKKIVKFPDIAHFDWETQAKTELQFGDPSVQAVDFGSGNGPFERLAALLGFEEALMSLSAEPEASYDLMNAIIDYKIDTLDYVKKYYKADMFTNYDDIATERGPFMSPDTYRELIKPLHKKLNDAVKAHGMIPIQHTCGFAQPLVKDFIETGAAAWTSVQPTNDIVSILKEYGSEICIIGGYNSNGAPARAESTPEEMIAETRRCFDTYGPYKGYIFFGFKLVNSNDPADMMKEMMPIIQESASYGRKMRVN